MGAIVGIRAIYGDDFKDRRFTILCCAAKPASYAGLNCMPYPRLTWINTNGGPFSLSLPEGAHINGIESEHDCEYE